MELTTERANAVMYQELAQTTEQALEDLRRSTDEFAARSQQDLTVKEVRLKLYSLYRVLLYVSLFRQNWCRYEKGYRLCRSRDKRLQTRKLPSRRRWRQKKPSSPRKRSSWKTLWPTSRAPMSERSRFNSRAIRNSWPKLKRPEYACTTPISCADRLTSVQEVQQKYQSILIDHSALLKERDTLQQQLREAQISAAKYLEEAKAAQSILSTSEQSWKLQADSITQELTDIRSRLVAA